MNKPLTPVKRRVGKFSKASLASFHSFVDSVDWLSYIGLQYVTSRILTLPLKVFLVLCTASLNVFSLSQRFVCGLLTSLGSVHP